MQPVQQLHGGTLRKCVAGRLACNAASEKEKPSKGWEPLASMSPVEAISQGGQ